jgi:two-component system, NtrC family, sensor kinase
LGLGLDTVQRVVAKHFGTVSFDTSTRGTTFYVRLPVDRTEIY